MDKKLIIFDADGTLWDSEKDIFSAFNYVLKSNQKNELDKKEFQSLAGIPLEKMFEKILPDKEKHLCTEYTKQYRQYYIVEDHFLDETSLFNGVKETLNILKNNGFILAIVSLKPNRALDKMVEHFNLNFDIVIGTGESNFKHKPDPESLLYILNKFNIKPENAVMVGDTKTDMLAGNNANVDTIAVTYGIDTKENLMQANPNYIIDNFVDLLDIIKN